MRRASRAVVAAGAAALVGAASSCTGPPALATVGINAAQAQTAVWVHGDVEAAERVTLRDLFAACHWALVDLDFPVEEETLYEHVGYIRGRAGNKYVKMEIHKLSSVASRFSIRVGTFGDEIVSR